MKNGFLTHLTTMTIIHALLLVGSFSVVESQMKQEVAIPKLGNGIMKMKVAAGLFLPQSAPKPQPQVVKKVVTSKPTVRPVEVQKPVTASVPQDSKPTADTTSNLGSAEGTGGRADGFAFGSGNGKGKYNILDLYKAELRATIDKNKYYPTMSRRLGQTGTVVIAFTLLEDGNIVNVRIDKPSQFERLNVSALDAVKKVERFKPIPKEAGDNKMDIKVPVKFVTI
jgi:TonB family protein